MKQKMIERGTRAVVITEDCGHVDATLWVNTRNGINQANITTARWTGRTMQGAERWAERVLA